MIKIYTDTSYLTEENRKNIFLIFLELYYTKKEWINNYFKIVENINDANYCVWPLEISFSIKKYGKNKVKGFLKESSINNKKVWIYSGGDFGWSYFNRYDYITTFRLSGFKSKLSPNTIIIPALIEDAYTKYDFRNEVITNFSKPSVGFVGHANKSYSNVVKDVLIHILLKLRSVILNEPKDNQKFYSSAFNRYLFLKQFEDISFIQSDFIFREKYRAGIDKNQSRKKTELEYFLNINSNLFTLCIRGAGNFSVRFYEVLSNGRIPFFIDTDCKLPFEDLIDWKKHIYFSKLVNGKIDFNDFYNWYYSKTEQELTDIQYSNRKLWLDYFERENFIRTIYNIFKK